MTPGTCRKKNEYFLIIAYTVNYIPKESTSTFPFDRVENVFFV